MNIISLVFHQHRKPFLAMFALTLLSGLLGKSRADIEALRSEGVI